MTARTRARRSRLTRCLMFSSETASPDQTRATISSLERAVGAARIRASRRSKDSLPRLSSVPSRLTRRAPRSTRRSPRSMISRWSRETYESVTGSISAFAGDALLFAPGTGFRYSSHGYTLLGAVLERVGGKGFGELLEREVATPMGLWSTGLDSPRLESGWARCYEILGGRYRQAFAVDNSRGWPGAGLRSSARDLSLLASALPEGGLLRRETLEAFLTPQKLGDGSDNPQNYALGWRLARTREFLGGRESYRVAHHGGVSAGGSAFLVLFPDQGVAVAVLANTRTGSSGRTGLRHRRAVHGEPLGPGQPAFLYARSPRALVRIAGQSPFVDRLCVYISRSARRRRSGSAGRRPPAGCP